MHDCPQVRFSEIIQSREATCPPSRLWTDGGHKSCLAFITGQCFLVELGTGMHFIPEGEAG